MIFQTIKLIESSLRFFVYLFKKKKKNITNSISLKIISFTS